MGMTLLDFKTEGKTPSEKERLKVQATDLKYRYYIRSNIRVDQNGRFIKKPVYLGGDTIVPTGGPSKVLKMNPPGPLAPPSYP